MTTVFMFPGQSSRDPEMLERIVAAWQPAAALVFDASDILGRDLAAHYRADNAAAFSSNRDIQVAVFLCSELHRRALADRGVTADLSLGLSLGEYNHLVEIGAVDFPSALRLVDARGAAYDRGPDGVMVSVFPLPADELEAYLDQVRGIGEVDIANLNSPSQNVIAGERKAVQAAVALIEEEDPAVRTVQIENRIPMHTNVFRPVAPELRRHLDEAPWSPPQKTYLPNVLGEFQHDADGDTIAGLLERHVYSPVLWRQSIDLIVDEHTDARFIEVGAGSVLFNLLQRSWHTNRKYRTDDPDGFAHSLMTDGQGAPHVS